MIAFQLRRGGLLLLTMAGVLNAQTKLDLQTQTNAHIQQDSTTGQVSTTKAFNAPLAAVGFSATPVFDAGVANVFTLTLAGNVTASTLTNAKSGQLLAFRICQDATGARAFSWPANFRGAGPVSMAPSACSQQTFVYDGAEAAALGAVLITGINGGLVTLPGATSGSTSIQPEAAASGALILPAANDTLVGRTTADTLQNKTISGTANTLSPTAAQTISGFTGCGGGKFLRDDGTCASASGGGSDITDLSIDEFAETFKNASGSLPYGWYSWNVNNGTTAGDGTAVSTADNPGGMTFTTTAYYANPDGSWIARSGANGGAQWNPYYGPILAGSSFRPGVWKTVMQFDANVSDIGYVFGLFVQGTLSLTTGDMDYVGVRFDPKNGDTRFQCDVRTGNTSHVTDAAALPAVNGNTKYVITISTASGALTCTVNGASTVTTSALPTNKVSPGFFYANTRNAAAHTLTVWTVRGKVSGLGN